uniref:Interferon-induced GTP-binding protein Mx2 n=1 Tax=Talaromyces marneffei PM1 TaxID=1077442 RepID=A0A093UMF5_TALMA
MGSTTEADWTILDWERVGDGLQLQTTRTSERLNQIDRVRANGIGDHVALPQLVVCGDQSAGKSSVLEGISGIPFPRQDGLCTRFATEIILRHDPNEQRAVATIIPHVSRTIEEKTRLSAFRHQLREFSELPGIIAAAATLMGVRGHGAEMDAPAFSADVLRLELVGKTGFHLTIVDLPGLISVSEIEEDVQLVENLVESYLENSRTIILAVVPASSDIDTQRIIQRARHFDKEGHRTVGIITKPDLINVGTESRVARLANNSDTTKLNLGFFLIKNPSPAELENGSTFADRRKSEVREDVRRLLNEVNDELNDLGTERSSPSQIRVYLTRISSDFHSLVKSGVEGSYTGRDEAFFRVTCDDMFVRLRAAIHMKNEEFATYMREHSEKRKVIYHETRGRELPGHHNYSLLTELFHAQSDRWGSISRQHVDTVVSLVSRFIYAGLAFIVKDPDVRKNITEGIKITLHLHAQKAYEELGHLLQDEARHPITYNHYYTDNIQKARLDRSKKDLKESMDNAIHEDWNGKFHVSNSEFEIKKLLNSLQNRVIVDMTEQACADARTDLAAYYKVAMKTFVDNVCRQVIERHILAKLPNVFDPITVSAYVDDDLVRLAAESHQTRNRRNEALRLQEALERSLRDLGI